VLGKEKGWHRYALTLAQATIRGNRRVLKKSDRAWLKKQEKNSGQKSRGGACPCPVGGGGPEKNVDRCVLGHGGRRSKVA
jgi:hypothetical protein